jgi:signal transduction histidine kinase
LNALRELGYSPRLPNHGANASGGYLRGIHVEHLEENARLVDQVSTEIRTLSHLLHPPLLDEVGLKSALTEYVSGFAQRGNIRVSLEIPADLERLPRDYELSIFRIVQECLTNIHRHSGSATAVVRIVHSPGEIQLEVTDQGRGIDREIQERFFAGKSPGVGLGGMRERVRHAFRRLWLSLRQLTLWRLIGWRSS